MKKARISGVGYHVPERIVSNAELGKMLDVTEEWIVKLTGIKERRWISEGETLINMAEEASRKAIDQAGLTPDDIGLIIFSSLGSDHQFPGGGCYLQERLGMPRTPALDIRNVCSGYIFGLSVADQYIKTGMYEHVLLVGAEAQSTSLDQTPRGQNVSILFGDGAGATVISVCEEDDKGILNTQIYTDGKYADRLWLDAPSPNDHPRISSKLIDSERIYPFMDGRTVFKNAVTLFPEVIREALDKAGLGISDLDLVIPHQANLRISEMVIRKLGIEKHKLYSNIEYFGNTTSASIPVALGEALEKGLIKDNSMVCLAAFGAGFSWGSSLIRW